MKFKVANPIYDAVFKYLMSDLESACILLSHLMDQEILDLLMTPTEHQVKLDDRNLTVYHLDFSARVRLEDGSERMVLIEIQKAKLPSDIMRFRRYLGNHYADGKNVQELPDGGKEPLPIFTIYFLGHGLEAIRVPVLRVARGYYDAATKERLEVRERFVESLTHDSVVVQIPYLTGRRRTELERLLSVFDQAQCDPEDQHLVEVDDEEYPAEYRPILGRLLEAVSDKGVVETMRVEDEVLNDLQEWERKVAMRDELLVEKQKALEEKERALEAERRRAEEKERVAEAERRRAEEKERELQATRRAAVEALVKTGMPREEAERMIVSQLQH